MLHVTIANVLQKLLALSTRLEICKNLIIKIIFYIYNPLFCTIYPKLYSKSLENMFRQEHQANLLWIPAESPYNLNQVHFSYLLR